MVNKSLKRLGVDYIDLFYLHRSVYRSTEIFSLIYFQGWPNCTHWAHNPSHGRVRQVSDLYKRYYKSLGLIPIISQSRQNQILGNFRVLSWDSTTCTRCPPNFCIAGRVLCLCARYRGRADSYPKDCSRIGNPCCRLFSFGQRIDYREIR